jgi:hypothetical protein
MNQIGSGWLVGPPALRDETILQRWRANHSVSPTRTAGGMLHLTNRRIVFAPHRISWWFSCDPWDVFLPDVAEVGCQDRAMTSHRDGSLRRRLTIRLNDDRNEFFVVARPTAVVAVLHHSLANLTDPGQ